MDKSITTQTKKKTIAMSIKAAWIRLKEILSVIINKLRLIIHNHTSSSENKHEREDLLAKINSLTKELEDAKRIEKDLKARIEQSTLDVKYSKTLICFQRIDDMFRNLEANIASPNFQNNVNLAIEEVFRAYGYMFVDYTEQTKDFYDCEYQPIDKPEVILRAVVRMKGNIAAKGKIFIPINSDGK